MNNSINQSSQFVSGMLDADYRKALGLSQSSIKEFLKSPAHYLASTEKTSEPTKAMLFGSAFHAMMLQQNPKDFYAVKLKVDGRTKEGKEYNLNFEQENAGKIVIDVTEEATLTAMKESIFAHEVAFNLLKESTHKETAVFGDYDFNQDNPVVRLKGLVDLYNENNGVICDLKTCEDASPHGFRKAIWDRRYDIQVVHYSWLLKNAGKPVSDFVFICVEKEAPYAVGCYRISVSSLEKTFEVWNSAIADFCVCQETGNYPAYSDSIEEIVL